MRDPKRVWVNVPYDAAYEQRRHAIVIALKLSGLTPDLALEHESGELRLEKIKRLMRLATWHIADISLEHVHNVPHELGIWTGQPKYTTPIILVDRKFVWRDDCKIKKFSSQLSNLTFVEPVHYENHTPTLVKKLLRRVRGQIINTERVPTSNEVSRVIFLTSVMEQLWKSGATSYAEVWDSEAWRELACNFDEAA